MDIPGFQIIREIGKGGMATVYLAIQESLDREVAIKVMSPFLTDEDTFGERFIREAKLVAKLAHPHIISVYDVGKIDDQYYIAMQLCAGGDLKQKLHEGLSEHQAIAVTKQIASALDSAHRKEIVHRDVKPANILFDLDGSVCLTDFGVAKAYGSATTTLTVAGSVIGTPTYMSPEQARGEQIDYRTDLYSLGVVFYEMLSGQPPYHGDSGISVAIKHISEPIPKLLTPQNRYQAFIDKLLSKNPEDRWQSGNEIIEELDRLQHDEQPEIHSYQTENSAVAPPKSNLNNVATTQKLAEPVIEHRQAKSQKAIWLYSAIILIMIMGGIIVYQYNPASQISSTATGDAPTIPKQVDLQQAEINEQQNTDTLHKTKLNKLLAKANTAYAAGNYITPEKSNAAAYYQEILSIDNNHEEAKNGLNRIGTHYIDLTKNAIRNGRLFLAKKYVEQITLVAPNHPNLSAVKNQLTTAQVKANAKQAATTITATQAVTTTPSKLTKEKITDKKSSSQKNLVQSTKNNSTSIQAKHAASQLKPAPKASTSSSANINPSPTPTNQELVKNNQSTKKPDKNAQILKLSKQAFDILAKENVTMGDINSAQQLYRQIKLLSPHHNKVKEGKLLIIGTCVNMANQKIVKKQYREASLYIDKGLSIDKRNRQLKILQKKIRR